MLKYPTKINGFVLRNQADTNTAIDKNFIRAGKGHICIFCLYYT